MAHSMEIPRSICREDALAPNNTKALRLVLIVAIFIFHAGIHMGFLTPDLGHAACLCSSSYQDTGWNTAWLTNRTM